MSVSGFRTLLLSLMFLLAPSAVLAQSETIPFGSPQLPEVVRNAGEETKTRAFLIADINVGDVTYTETDGAISGSFSLRGNMGEQHRIVLAVVVRDGQNRIVHIEPIPGVRSIKKDQVEIIPFTYRFPDFLGGEVTVFVRAETTNGVLLGQQRVIAKTLPVLKTPPLECTSTEPAPSFSCFADGGSRTVTFRYYNGSALAEPAVIEGPVMIGSAKQTFAPKLAPGRYHVQALEASGRSIYFSLRVPGVYGMIQNAVITPATEPGIAEAIVTVMMSPVRGSTVTIRLSNPAGEACGEVIGETEGFVKQALLKISCIAGTVRYELRDASGQTLDILEESFDMNSLLGPGAKDWETPQSGELVTENRRWFGFAILLGSVLLIGASLFFLAWLRRSKAINTLVFVLASASLMSLAPLEVRGASFLLMTMSTDAGSEIAWQCSVSIDLDRASYAPGDTVVISGSVDLSHDIGATGTGQCAVGYMRNTSNTGPAFDNEVRFGWRSVADTGPVTAYAPGFASASGSDSFTIPSHLAPGAHTVREIYAGAGGDERGGRGVFDSASMPLNFSVTTLNPGLCEGEYWPGTMNCIAGEAQMANCPTGYRVYEETTDTMASCMPINPATHVGRVGRCVADTSCTACRTNIVVQSDDVCSGNCSFNANIHRVQNPSGGAYNQAWWNTSGAPGSCFGSCATYPLSGHPAAEISSLPICSTPPPPICVLGAPSWAGHSPVGNFGVGLDRKTSMCPAGQVMTGIRDYQWTRDVDEEFVEAYCAPGAGALGAATRIEAPNAWGVPNPGYKEAICPAGQVMVGAEMFGIYAAVDEEHVDAYCAPLPSATLGAPFWVSAPNAGSTMFGGYKEARCPANHVMVGTRWFQWPSNVDEEHTDAYCAPITVACGAAANITVSSGAIVSLPDTWWQKLWKYIRGVGNVAHAAPPAANIVVNQGVNMSWSSSGVDTCEISAVPGIPGFPINMPPLSAASGSQPIPPYSMNPGTTYRLTITCTGATGGATDFADINVAAATDFRVCPATPIVGPAATSQMRAYYVTTGTVNCGNLAGAIEVTNDPSTNWASGNAGIATVNNAGSKGLVTGISSGSTTITATYLSYSDPETITVSCTPTVSCADPGPTATAANTCVGATFPINDGCGSTINCSGTRTCDFNWKEVAP